MKKLIYFIPSFLIMFLIFSFSNQTGSESSGLSHQILVWIQNYLHITLSELIIRKTAHMSEYALLCFSFIYGFYKSQFSLKQILFYSLVCCFVYACTDEFHQLFIGGRAGQIKDVLIDTFGSFIACLISYFYLKKQDLK